MATKTMCIRIKDEDYKFLAAIAREEKEDVSKTIRELVDLGRVTLAVNKYKKAEASLEKSAKIAGVSISKMIDILGEYGVAANLEMEDYLKGLQTIRKIW